MDRRTRFLYACYGQKVDRTPVWLMRQAGRYMPEYNRIRKNNTFLQLCQTPELSARITQLPLERFGFDAAILFTDLLIILLGMGCSLEYDTGIGPIVKPPNCFIDGAGLLTPVPERDFPYLAESIRLFIKQTNGTYPLIGFAGAPFTLASYVIEGGTSKTFAETKKMLFQNRLHFEQLLSQLSRAIIDYCRFQIQAGVDAIQIFDSWAGCLSPQDYIETVLPHTRTIFETLLAENVPLIYFFNGSCALLSTLRLLGAHVISIDSFQTLSKAREILGPDIAVQGNLDPYALFLPKDRLRLRIMDVLHQNNGRPGHIFNLGHGIHPDTNEENVHFLVKTVLEESIITAS